MVRRAPECAQLQAVQDAGRVYGRAHDILPCRHRLQAEFGLTGERADAFTVGYAKGVRARGLRPQSICSCRLNGLFLS